MTHYSARGVRLRRNLGATLLASLAALAPLPAAPPAWLKLETAEFVVYSDAPEKQVVDCAVRYAAYRRAFGELLLEPGRTLPPSTLLLFRREKSFRALTPPVTAANTKLVNYATEVDGTPLNAFALAGDRDRALQLTFEFETIWALRRIGHFVPVWMSQGTGEVLASVTVAKGKCIVGDEGHRSFDTRFEWSHFFEIGESSKEYREGKQALSEYLTQAWGLMHWILLVDGGSRLRFETLEQQLRNHSALEAVTTVMNTPADQLARSIRRHFAAPWAFPFDEATVKAGFHVTPAPEAEVLVQTSNLLAATGRISECDLQLDQARALAPDLPAVKEAWARRMLREGRQRDAVAYYREAIAAGSKNFAAYVQSAVMRLNDNMSGGGDRAGDGGPAALAALAELRQAIKLNPGSSEVFRLLGRTLYVLPNLTEAHVAELSPGVTATTEGEAVRFYRALLYARLDRREDCAADFRAILADPETSPQLQRGAQNQFTQEIILLDARRVERQVAAHDYAAAFAIVTAGEREPESALAAGYDRLRTWLVKAVRLDDNASAADRQLAGLD